VAKTTWKIKLLIFSIIITLLGLIQWESWFNIEIRNHTLRNLADGELACLGIFLLVCTGFPMILNRTSGVMQGFLFFIYALLILISGVACLFSTIGSLSAWEDVNVYHNGTDYVIIQHMDYPVPIDREDWRLIRTTSPTSTIRFIEEQQKSIPDESRTKNGIEINFANKTWYKVSLPDD
jgi:hypothetical protein